MQLHDADRQWIKQELRTRLGGEAEVRKVVIFGSFLSSPSPHDLDVAVFQESDQSYLPLALKYRKLTRAIARLIPMDVFPLRSSEITDPGGSFVQEILRGEVVYER